MPATFAPPIRQRSLREPAAADVADTDTDSDGTADCNDADDDNDGVADGSDSGEPRSRHLRRQSMTVTADDDCAVGTDDFGPLADNDLPANDGAGR